MQQTPPEVIIAFFGLTLLWLLLILAINLLAPHYSPARSFWGKMLAQRKIALGIALVYVFASLLTGKFDLGLVVGGIAYFCEALIGLALVYSIPGAEPLAVTRAVIERRRPVRAVVLLVAVGVIAGVVGLFIGSLGMGIVQSLVGEVNRTQEAVSSFQVNKFQAFFMFLSGAGIAEETPYRLLLVSLVWRFTRIPWLAILVGAVAFGAYHLSPLNGMYLQWWQFPVSQFLSSAMIGLLWGYLFVKRGYETSVLGHTMSDWITVLLFT